MPTVYDALNRLTNMVDGVGTTKYTYTSGGELWTEDGPWASDTVTNIYSNRLRTALYLQQPTGLWTNGFGYDSAKRLTNVTSEAGSFGYMLGGAGGTSYASPLIKKLLLPNTSYITNTYDSVARLLSTVLKTSGGSALDSHAYTYNVASQRTNQTFTDSSTVAYRYDKIGQLTVADSSINSEDRGYAYDAAWNLSYQTNNGTPTAFTVDSKNELVTDDGNYDYYDSNGNLEWRCWGSTPWWWTTASILYGYTYDDENRLTVIDYYDYGTTMVWETQLTYDGLGRLRIRKEYDSSGSLTSETHYVYDGMRVIQERNGSNTPTVSYTRGTDLSGSLEGAGGIGGLLARSSGYSGGNWSTHNYYHADGNGNITYLVNSSQGLAASYKYDAFGNTLSSSGTLASANVYRFSSKEIHVNSGLYYFGFRWYDPNVQR